ncbi:3-deoxy-D-manno-octulosonic acid transferase [Bordetella genomosp. 4]|uniref:3-deoxy-D-manno-octulosonic acid transferase n=1 Tax=Bordetella genomosp. 4 TaxID=463044 RepID=A0A261TK96_9BORD|nr:3-deoxy-D-manno-octulosonic acid transferase [Bordetella genomosp. 4]OZI50054.1 3-deoxy-D-manno-octulosonic acid transferase [Bordetella genomosp. 4]
MRRGTYTLALYALAPLVWLWMGRRARRAGGDWGIFSGARFGRADDRSPAPFARPPIWVHAVSLGETRAAQPLIQALLERGLPVLLTHTTATGRDEGARLFAEAIAAGQLRQTWLPYDFPGAVRGFLRRYGPRCGLLIEREVWPNLLAQAQRQGIRMALISARFSASSLRQAGWMGRALRDALAGLDAVLAQTPEDAQRLEQAGARRVSVTGNLKFDLSLPAAQVEEGRAWHQAVGRPVVAVASTREGEDALFVRAIKALRNAQTNGIVSKAESGDTLLDMGAAARARSQRSVLYLVIPRHPQRFEEVAQQLNAAGLTYMRRTQARKYAPQDLAPRAMPQQGQLALTQTESLPLADLDVDVMLGDTLGEMPFYFAAADVAIVAGSFVPLGGHNLIEACAAGVPVIVGPHTFNFKQAATDAIAAGAALRASDVPEALDAALALLDDENRRLAMSRAARDWAAAHAGATERTLQTLQTWLSS